MRPPVSGFSWWMPDKSRDSLAVAVLLHAAAMIPFINATAEVRGRISERFERIIRSRLADGGYDPEDQSLESFKVHIYGPDLDWNVTQVACATPSRI